MSPLHIVLASKLIEYTHTGLSCICAIQKHTLYANAEAIIAPLVNRTTQKVSRTPFLCRMIAAWYIWWRRSYQHRSTIYLAGASHVVNGISPILYTAILNPVFSLRREPYRITWPASPTAPGSKFTWIWSHVACTRDPIWHQKLARCHAVWLARIWWVSMKGDLSSHTDSYLYKFRHKLSALYTFSAPCSMLNSLLFHLLPKSQFPKFIVPLVSSGIRIFNEGYLEW